MEPMKFGAMKILNSFLNNYVSNIKMISFVIKEINLIFET